jgi:hypothetical protein
MGKQAKTYSHKVPVFNEDSGMIMICQPIIIETRAKTLSRPHTIFLNSSGMSFEHQIQKIIEEENQNAEKSDESSRSPRP